MKILTYFLTIMMSIIFSLILSPMAVAKTINLYDQPKADAKVIGNLDTSAGIIPIFQSQDQKWVKVGDPRNGNVGWIKSSDITTNGADDSVSVTQKIIDDKGQTQQSFQFGTTMTPKEQQEMIKKMQIQQKNAQEQMQKAMENIIRDMNTFLQNFPLLLPGAVVTPPQKTSQQPKPETKITQPAPTTPPAASTPPSENIKK